MALPDTITVKTGPAGSEVTRVFTRGGTNTSGTITTYYAPSPQNDLAGRPVLEIEQSVSKGGIMRTRRTFKFPIYDATSGSYKGSVNESDSLTRPASAPLATAAVALEAGSELGLDAAVKDSILQGTM